MTLVTTVLPIALLSGIGIKMTKDSLRGEIETNIENMAVEKARAIETTLFSKIDETVILATHPLIVTAVRASNAQRYRGGDDSEVLDEILALDREWIEQAAGSPVSLSIASNQVSEFLRKYQNRDSNKYSEKFITDATGVTIAMTKPLSDYYQADESWWVEGFASGSGSALIDDRGYDDNVKALVAGVVVPVMNAGKVAQ